MRVYKGDSSHRSRGKGKPSRVVPCAKESKSVYVLVHRRNCAREAIDSFPSRMKRGLALLSAVLIDTAEAASDQWDWTDTYRVPLHGKTVQEVTAQCRNNDIMDGPHCGVGRVSAGLAREDGSVSAFCGPAGAGDIPQHAKPSARRNAKYREVTSRENECLPVDLMHRLGIRWAEVGPIPLDGATGKPDSSLKACSVYYDGATPLNEKFSWWEWRNLHLRWLGFVPVFIHLCRVDMMKAETLLEWARTRCGESKVLNVSGIDPDSVRQLEGDSFSPADPGKQWMGGIPLTDRL